MSATTTSPNRVQWEMLPFFADALRAMEPQRVTVIGRNVEHWGVLLNGLTEKSEDSGESSRRIRTTLHAPAEIGARASALFDRVTINRPNGPDETDNEEPDAIVFATRLDQLDRPKAEKDIRKALATASYVLLLTRLGDRGARAAPDSESISTWSRDDLAIWPIVSEAIVSEPGHGLVLGLVLSARDPRQVAQRQSADAGVAQRRLISDFSPGLDQVLRQTADAVRELAYVKSHSSYRLGKRLRSSGVWNRLRWLRNRNRRIVTIRVLADRHARSEGHEVWLTYASPKAGTEPIPWDFIEADENWGIREADEPYGAWLLNNAACGALRVPIDEDPELRFVSHAWSGRVEILFQGRREVVELFHPEAGQVTVFPARTPMVAPETRREPTGALHPQVLRAAASGSRPQSDEDFLKRVRATRSDVVAVHCPRWMGVTNSTETLFPLTYPVPATAAEEPYKIDENRLAQCADVLCESGVRHIVFSGGDEIHHRLMKAIKTRKPNLRCDLLWHGPYLFFAKDYDWNALKRWIESAREGLVSVVGTVKRGMEEFFQAAGLSSRLILNYVPGPPDPPPVLPAAPHRVGMWMSDASWKVPHAMLSALIMVGNCRLHAAGLSPRAEEVAQFFGLPLGVFHRSTLPRQTLHEEIRRTHLTLYVTFTECCPMLPLESIRLGVPCLVGPVSHLFEDHDYLRSRLIVPCPDRADVIANYVRQALDERDQIMRACAEYIPAYNAAAQRSIEAFLA